MIALNEHAQHEEVWLLLPWLATGRLSPAQREMAQEHVRRCKECEQEFAAQQLACDALTQPDRVTYAPGPSFRKLMDRINSDSRLHDGEVFGITGMTFTAYRLSAQVFRTVTDPPVITPNVLHIALDRSLPMGEVEGLLQAGGARIVEGPSSTGELGVTPIGVVAGQTTEASANNQLRALSARLRADPRVLWVQPLADEGTPADPRSPAAADQRAPHAREH